VPNITKNISVSFTASQPNLRRIDALCEQNGGVNRSRVLNAVIELGLEQMERHTKKNPD